MEQLSDESVFRLKVAKSCCNAFSSIIMYPIHILNFLTDEFLYLSETKDFIGGYTSDDISGRGWKFFIDICIPQGRNVLSKAIVFADDFFSKLPVEKKKDYSISFNYTIKVKDSNMDMKVNHQLAPLYIDSMNRAAVFIGTVFPGSNALGNTMLIRNVKEGKRWAYNVAGNCLEALAPACLTPMEKRMMSCACSGMTTNMMSSILNKSADTINGYRKSVIAKLGVQNLQEAVTMVLINKLL